MPITKFNIVLATVAVSDINLGLLSFTGKTLLTNDDSKCGSQSHECNMHDMLKGLRGGGGG